MSNSVIRRASDLWSRSVTNRLTAFSLLVFLISTLALGLLVTRLLRHDMEQVLAAQQLSTTRMMATMLDREMGERLIVLDQIGALAGQRLPEGRASLQAMIDGAPAFRRLFNGGGFITNAQGVAVAAWPLGSGREGVNYGDRDYVKSALATGKATAGQPVIGRTLGVPVLGMAAPIRDARGQMAGVVAGVIDLHAADFLDQAHGRPLGETGSFLVIDPVTRRVLSASDKRRVMEQLPAPGLVADLDQILAGSEGTRRTVNRDGVPVLTTSQRVDSTGWTVLIAVPISAAFRPASELERRLLVGIAILGLAASLVTWVLIRRQLQPLHKASRSLSALGQDARAGRAPQPLKVSRPDEVGQLITEFNALLEEIGVKQHALVHSEMLYSTAFQISPDPVSITRLSDGTYLQVNESFSRLFGWKSEEVIGRSAVDLGIWRRQEDRRILKDVLQRNGRVENLETELVTRGGQVVTVQVSASLMVLEGENCLLAVTHDITARRQAQRQIETLAFSDPLTGLPNRRLLTERLGQTLVELGRNKQHAALLFIDLDDFKQLNDSLGHAAGDQLLRAVAMELRTAVRLSDTVARLGGDEFVVLLKDLPGDLETATAHALAMATQLREATSSGAARIGSGFHASVSIGVAMAGREPLDSQELMRHADLAMYRAKEAGRGQIKVFSQDMLDSLSTRAEMETDLRRALGSDQLTLHYQPQVGPEGRIIGAEALVRWTRPGFGPVSPAAFIPVAEDSGLILPLGRWILETACRQLAAWAREPATRHLLLAVNMSSRQFQQPDLVDVVKQVLAATGADPTHLRLELTESVLIESFDAVAARMQSLKAIGVGFALDDFGTGFSSLAYLKRLPLNELKIDASFVRDIETDVNDRAIAQMIVALGSTLGLQVLAEGVETEAQCQHLANIGCYHYQGYFFGRPKPAEEFLAQVHSQTATA